MHNKKIKTAFTLAEVLITLLIIGVIASIVVPNLINDSRDAELNTALKKVYAELSLATRQIIYDNGGTFIGVLATDSDHTGLKNKYSEYLSHTKSCNNARDEGCWHPLSTDGGTWKTLEGGSTDTYTNYSGLILNDGTLINFISFSKTCTRSIASYTKPIICSWIIVDVNGFKKPNVIGKDVFYFHLLADKIEPFGAPDSSGHLCRTDGLYCTVVKLMQ